MEVDIKTMYHRNAPDTEREAAEKIAPRVTGLRLKVLSALADKGETGATGEVITNILGEWLYSVKPRITELSRYGLVEDSGRRVMNSRKRNEIVWQITESGRNFLNG
jgi:hypothetical protein